MTGLAPAHLPLRGPQLTEEDFTALAALLQRHSGILMSPQKRVLMQSRLLRRLRVCGLGSFSDYRRLLESPAGAQEQQQMISALTTNVTRFFREARHFDDLRSAMLPDLITRARAGGRVRIWSAGCSTGQEPYSLAMTLLDLCPEAARLDIRILGTDIDPVAIAQARAGLYAANDLAQIPGPLRARFVSHQAESRPELGPAPRALVVFRELNLLGSWPFSGRFDVIFCRNVVIYFGSETQAGLWPRFAAALHPEGRLYIGHSERIPPHDPPLFKSAGSTAYTLG